MHKSPAQAFIDKYGSLADLVASHSDLSVTVASLQNLRVRHFWPCNNLILGSLSVSLDLVDVIRHCDAAAFVLANGTQGVRGALSSVTGGTKDPDNDYCTFTAASTKGFIANVVMGAGFQVALGTTAGQHIKIGDTTGGGWSVKGATGTQAQAAPGEVAGVNFYTLDWDTPTSDSSFYYGLDGETDSGATTNTAVGNIIPTNTEFTLTAGITGLDGIALHENIDQQADKTIRRDIGRLICREWSEGNKICFYGGVGFDYSDFSSNSVGA